MPIRFACPHCHQKLSVSSRKAGTSADCPRCKRKLSIPTPPPEPERPPPPKSLPPVAPPHVTPAAPTPVERFAPPAFEQAIAHPAPETAVAVAEPPPELPAAAEVPIWSPDPAGYEGMELVYDATESTSPASTGAEHAELVAIPRYVLYLQGGLIGVVALVAFAIGILTGGALLTQPPPPSAPQALLISGTVTYAAGPRSLPDEGAVIAILPQTQSKLDEKAPVAGLRPDDPTPGDTHRGLAILRDLGGGYTRTDPNGHFQVQVPDRGHYLVLVISNQKQVRSAEDTQTTDIIKLRPYFDNATDLLGNHRYQLTLEWLRGDHDLIVPFD